MSAQTAGSDDAGAISIVALFCAALFALWYFSGQILSWWQAIIVPFSHLWAWLSTTEIGVKLAGMLNRDPAVLQKMPAYLASLNPESLKEMGYTEAKRYGDYIHRFTTLVFGPLFIIWGFKLLRHSNMNDPLMFRVTKGIPAITSILKTLPGREWMADVVDTSKMDMFNGKIALQAPVTPWRFAELYGIVECDEHGAMVSFDKEKAAAAYCATFGKKFTTIDALAKGDYGKAWKALLDQLPPQDRPNAMKAAAKGHLYEKTVVIALLRQMSRVMIIDYGPLMHVRYKDIAFFDAICSCGRRTAFAAGAGLMGQFRHEVAIYNASKGDLEPEEKAGGDWAASWLEEALRTDPHERPWVESDDVWQRFDPWE
jgi:hypothetical protein